MPSSDIDLFSTASLRDPFDDYRVLRDLGPVVRLDRLDVLAVSRFAAVQESLRASDRLISGQGIGLGAAFNASAGNNVIQSDGDTHRRFRAAIARPLGAAEVAQVRSTLREMIKVRVGALAGAGEFDAMADLCRFLPMEAISHFVGLRPDGRERMLQWAAATFNLVGPHQDPADLASLAEARSYMETLDAETVTLGSWSRRLFDTVEAGKLTMHEALGAISAYILPSLDTTILAKGHLLYNLARAPDQWALLQREPARIKAAVLEGVRHSSVIRWFARVAATDQQIDGVPVAAGQRVLLLYGSANRDERRYKEPDRFDITRDARDHLAWGSGPHMCAGMHLARVEMEVLLEALLARNATLHAGEPERGVNQGLFGYTRLPFRID